MLLFPKEARHEANPSMTEKSERTYLVDDPAMREKMARFVTVSHSKALGLECLEISRNNAWGRIPYQEKLVGNIETGAVHTGVLISLMDSIAGMAVQCAFARFEVIVTLDLRLDCYKPSLRGQDLICHAECHRLTNTIAFVRGSIYHHSPENPIAGCVASFYRVGRSKQ